MTISRRCFGPRSGTGNGRLRCGLLGGGRDALHARRRQDRRERAAPARLAFDRKFGLVPQQDMIDDRKAKSGAARFPRAAAIHAVEALRQPRQMFARNSHTGVGNCETAATVRIDEPGQRDRAAIRRVAHRVGNEIAECARELFACAAERCGRVGGRNGDNRVTAR